MPRVPPASLQKGQGLERKVTMSKDDVTTDDVLRWMKSNRLRSALMCGECRWKRKCRGEWLRCKYESKIGPAHTIQVATLHMTRAGT